MAVEGLSFTVQPGEILGLLGPNGAGKTTTLRSLVGIIPPTQGKLSIDGEDIVESPVAAKLKTAYIPDDPHLFDSLTVWEHLRFVADAYRIQNYEETGERLLDLFELTEKRNTLTQELSRGMRQKVVICCAYLHNPAAILFDEPMTGLDPRAIRILKTSITEKAKAGAAIIISSHLLALIQDLCTHLLILHRGKSLFTGPIAEARSAFSDLRDDSSLEEVFFRATEGNHVASSANGEGA